MKIYIFTPKFKNKLIHMRDIDIPQSDNETYGMFKITNLTSVQSFHIDKDI